MVRCLLVAVVCATLGAARGSAAEPPLPNPRYAHVSVGPAKTSIYVGTVTLTTPAFSRKNGAYESAYTARVFPYFFYNEAGTLSVEMSDDQLRRLGGGEPVDFKGHARRADGAERRITGRATPRDASSGKLKVRVWVSQDTELIFNTTYQFGVDSPALE